MKRFKLSETELHEKLLLQKANENVLPSVA